MKFCARDLWFEAGPHSLGSILALHLSRSWLLTAAPHSWGSTLGSFSGPSTSSDYPAHAGINPVRLSNVELMSLDPTRNIRQIISERLTINVERVIRERPSEHASTGRDVDSTHVIRISETDFIRESHPIVQDHRCKFQTFPFPSSVHTSGD